MFRKISPNPAVHSSSPFVSFLSAAKGWRGEGKGGRPRKIRTLLMAASKMKAIWNHPVGPKTVFFWAPTFKWGLIVANAADFATPPEKVSYPQQVAVALTGVIWSRYSAIIKPRNINLLCVNLAMAGTGIYQLSRKIRYDYSSEELVEPAKE